MSDYFVSSLWGIPLLSFITAGAGAYIGGYLKKRGENLATKEDFNDLKAQTAALTQTTKEIEAKINDQVWNRQRQWELKRDTLIETIRSMSEFRNANSNVIEVFSARRSPGGGDAPGWLERRTEVIQKWQQARDAFDRARLLTLLLGDAAIEDALANLATSLRQSFTAITSRQSEEQFREAMKQMNDYHDQSFAAIRAALGFGETAPQSTVSSGVPTPDRS
jgi:hypothetical protein